MSSPTAQGTLAHHALGATPRTTARRATIACALGNALEMYDFTIYSFFAVIIAHNFFPAQSELASLMMSLTTFGIGFLMRPIGAIVIGRIADQRGRKAALSLTISLMTLGTAMIAFAPTFAQAGIVGTLVLVLGRLVQGFSAGGEIGTASVFLMESSEPGFRCRNLAWQGASQSYAALFGAAMGLVVTTSIPSEQLNDWGWRLPFMLGLVIGPVGWYIRRYLPETFEAPRQKVKKASWRERYDLRNIVLTTGLMAGTTIGMYLFIFYMPAYLVTTLHYPQSSAMAIPCVAAACGAIITPLAARIADRYQLRKKLLLCTLPVSLALTWVTFWVLGHTQSLPLAMLMIAIQTLPSCLGGGAFFALVTESFERRNRALGCAVSYSFGVTLFGGFSPLIATWLIGEFQTPFAPLYYLYFGGAISLTCLLLIKEQPGRE